MVATKTTVGKDENSKGLEMKRAVMRIRKEKAIDMARQKSSRNLGMGKIRTAITDMNASANMRSVRFASELKVICEVI